MSVGAAQAGGGIWLILGNQLHAEIRRLRLGLRLGMGVSGFLAFIIYRWIIKLCHLGKIENILLL